MSSRILSVLFVVIILCLNGYHPVRAQSVSQFPYNSICSDSGKVEYRKLIGRLSKDIDISKALDDVGQVDQAVFRRLLLRSGALQFFKQQLLREKGRFYRVVYRGNEVEAIDPKLLLEEPRSYTIICVKKNRSPSEYALLRKKISDKFSKIGDKLILRKNRDNFSKSLAEAAPAKFSFSRDEIKNNSLVQSDFAVGTQFVLDIGFDPGNPDTISTAVPLFILPYVQHKGSFNSNASQADIDNLSFGVLFDIYAIPVSNWLDLSFSIDLEYLTDSENKKEIFASEFIWYPASSANTQWPIELGQRMYFDEFLDGSSVRFDWSGRLRYGLVEDNAGITSLDKNSEYMRLGFKGHVDLTLGGDDLFSGMKLFANYWYFQNLIGDTGVGHMHKIETGLRYDLSKYHGFEITYEEGRNEDTMQKINQITAALTLKFGETDQVSTPTFE